MIRRDSNGGKGAAVKTGLAAARELGFTHALQIDADGQHDTADIPKFLARAAERPQAAVLGHPVYDASMPRGRIAAHALTNFMVFLQTGGRAIGATSTRSRSTSAANWRARSRGTMESSCPWQMTIPPECCPR